MRKLQRLFAGFLSLVLLATWPSLAYGQTISDAGDYTVVKEGEKTPFSGYLFDADGVIKIMVNKSLEIQKITITKDAEIAKLNIELDALKKQHALEIKIKDDLNNSISSLKDNRIKLLEDSHKWDDVKLFGALLLGIVLSVSIFYASVQITNNIKITTQ